MAVVNSANGLETDEDANETIEVHGATIGRMGDPVAVNPDEYQFSEAETRIWLDDHLKNIKRPARIYYEFIKSGSYEDGFTDSIYLDIVKINDDGTKNAAMEFFTGERAQPANADNLTNITGNPVLGIYMQGDTYEMNRLTNGSWRYFQRRLKFAFADQAKVEQIKFRYDGHEVSGEKISIRPYVNDPRRRQFAEFADKSYEFILSDEVPGSLYQIKTTIPDNSGPDNKEPLIEELLTLRHVEYRG